MKRHLALNVARSISASEELSRAKKELELEMRLDFSFFSVMERTKTKELTSYSWPVPIG